MPTYRKLGDALLADKIAASARLIDKVTIDKRTHRHKGQFITLRGDAFCVVEIPLRAVLDRK